MRDELPKPGGYYDALGPLCTRLEIWHTIYNQCSTMPPRWWNGSREPAAAILDPLEPPERKQYLAEYSARIAATYLPQADGKVLLRFPRIFIVA